jgi:hypothetical protein
MVGNSWTSFMCCGRSVFCKLGNIIFSTLRRRFANLNSKLYEKSLPIQTSRKSSKKAIQIGLKIPEETALLNEAWLQQSHMGEVQVRDSHPKLLRMLMYTRYWESWTIDKISKHSRGVGTNRGRE